MKILILGGTRLLGRALVKKLFSDGHDVTVMSRRNDNLPDGVQSILAERSDGLCQIVSDKFDIVFDFLAYQAVDVMEVIAKIGDAPYFLISSTWLTRLAEEKKADQLIKVPTPECVERLPPITRKYLLGKNDAESAVLQYREAGHSAGILRMPIFWGAHDHTGRIVFYADRILDGRPVILVDGGLNLAQVAWVEDIATAISQGIPHLINADRVVWECLPHSGLRVKDVISDIALGLNQQPTFVNISKDLLLQKFPAYLDAEPLWREFSLDVTEANLFVASGVQSHSQSMWLAQCVALQSLRESSDLRATEIKLMKDLINA